MNVDLCQSVELRSLDRSPNRLHLRKSPISTTWYIVYRQRLIGQVDTVSHYGEPPPILLEKPFSEAFKDRIRDLVNKRDGTNRNIVVRCAPDRNDPAILRFLRSKGMKW